MKSKGFKIYVDGKLRIVCGNPLVAMSNFENLKSKYGSDRVEVKEYEFDGLSKVELQDLKENMDSIFNRATSDYIVSEREI